jgi:hypothetical protein
VKTEAQMKAKHPATHGEYLRGKNPGLQEAANQSRKLVKKTLPKAKESINPWHVPIFESHGPIRYYMAGKNHITLGFIHGTSLRDPSELKIAHFLFDFAPEGAPNLTKI